MPWLALNDKNLPSFIKGQKIEVSKLELYEVTVVSLDSFRFSMQCFRFDPDF